MINTQENKHEGHDHSKEYKLIVNGREKIVTKKELTFDEVVALAFDNPPTGENVLFTITYQKGENNKEGSLTAGETVKIKNGMIFNVTPTDRS